MLSEVISAKLARVAAGKPLRVLDLFAGCGGLSLGFLRAGCQPKAAVEINGAAAQSYAIKSSSSLDYRAITRSAPRDMKDDPRILAEELAVDTGDNAIDVLVGGPPCQAYARIGRAKLGDLADHPEHSGSIRAPTFIFATCITLRLSSRLPFLWRTFLIS